MTVHCVPRQSTNSRTIRRPLWLAAAIGVCALLLGTRPLSAQLEIPAFNTYGATDSTLMINPSIAVANLSDIPDSLFGHHPWANVDFGTRDSVHNLMRKAARGWLARLPEGSSSGIQSEPFVKLLVAADEDSVARRHIAERLASPGLSLSDRAFILSVAVAAFADPLVPQRFAIAEQYLKQLNGLGPKAAQRRYQAEIAMVDAYDEAGQTAEVARHGVAAVHLVPLMALKDLEKLHWAYLISPYMTIASAVSVQPHGAATIKEMNTIMTASTATTPDSVAMDSLFYIRSKYQTQNNAELLLAVSHLGTVPGPIYSNRWLNRPDSSAGSLPMNDGTVRVVQTADYGCPGCILSALHLQTLAARDSLIHPVLLTWTESSWLNQMVTPDSSAAILTKFWVNHLGLKYPIAMWIAYQRDTLSDGRIMGNTRDDSALAHYPMLSRPQFYVIDGQGRIRASFLGGGENVERQIVGMIHHLVAEQKQQQHAATASPTPTVGGQ